MWDLDDMQLKKVSLAPLTSACTDEVGPKKADLHVTQKTVNNVFVRG